MEDIIQRLVEIDRQCASKVDAAKSKKLDAQTNMNEKKKEIYNSFIQQQTQEVLKHKENLVEQNKIETKKQDEVYQQTIVSLETVYQANKEKWINEIVDRCLK